ncbi:putative glucuronoxylan glucuronosyltransferase IRX7 [Cinnamomum micranthum f. kanehirae]|uniref:Putative glucuronoxylan glucuronosyltransferase IRX7 n=1 Tax=Cinnamomum micranthum f. kanehirae TaxID=337451 RepID=A0A443N169_9MAGN|nr:putative glucuronoxylan glucuronosyltransferase IRX7 [Cinnamomum micranthum f. kanehirae]
MLGFNRSINSRGFYMKMKLLGRQSARNKEKKTLSSYHKYFIKWVFCICISLYFYTSYRFTTTTYTFKTTKIIHPSKTATTHFASRAVIEETISATTNISSRTTNGHDKLTGGDLKVYVYDLPSKYNEVWLSNRRCSSHLFAAEVAVHRAVMGSGFRTLDPSEADFFFVPVYVSCNFSTVNGFPSLAHARPLLASAVDLIAAELPFWNRSGGSDHVFVASHDYGACFHAVEELAIADGIPEFLKKSIVLQTFGVRPRHPCQEVEHVLIPPYVSPEAIRSTLQKAKERKGKRDIFAFFRGKMELHPKNISGRFYGNGVRTVLWKRYSHNRKFYLKRSRYAGYQSEMARSVFCLCPLGWAPWSPRLVESVALGCVPVIIADGIRLPFPSSVPWPTISLTVPQKDIRRLSRILDRVAATNLSAIQRNLWDPSVRRAMLYHGNVQSGDATWHILDALSRRKQRKGQSGEDAWR